ncbi:hypothetical protein, partial [Streptomyces somaliensis]|uniref:hypothetical protein n=1 Tax=Streptomyces somaliensis TaxID=78355 RepID=UPI00263B8638
MRPVPGSRERLPGPAVPRPRARSGRNDPAREEAGPGRPRAQPAGRPPAYNKWDELDEERRYYLEREIETEMQQVSGAPR